MGFTNLRAEEASLQVSEGFVPGAGSLNGAVNKSNAFVVTASFFELKIFGANEIIPWALSLNSSVFIGDTCEQ